MAFALRANGEILVGSNPTSRTPGLLAQLETVQAETIWLISHT